MMEARVSAGDVPSGYVEVDEFMNDLEKRVEREARIYDSGMIGRERFENALAFANEGIGRQRRNEFIREALRPSEGARVLEIGSQAWEWCLYRYEYRPASLTCINISDAELEIGRSVAHRLGVDVEFRHMDAHQLNFADASMDVVFGMAILHHLEFSRAMREIHRVLRPGGLILFVEPLRANPVAKLVRWLTPQARTPDELPLSSTELNLIGKNFQARNYYSELFTVPGALISQWYFKEPVNPITRWCDALDRRLVNTFPRLGPYYRSVIICGEKSTDPWRN